MSSTANPRRRFAVNTLLSIGTWSFPLALAFISTPILVRRLGNEKYGIYAIAIGFVSYAFSSGVGRITTKYIPELRSAGNPEKIPQIVSATFWVTFAIGTTEALALALAAPFIVSEILLVDARSQSAVVHALYLASAGGLFLMLGYVFQYVLQGLHRFDMLSLTSGLSALLLNIGSVILVVYGYGVNSLMLLNAVVFACMAFLYYWSSRIAFPALKLGLGLRLKSIKEIGKYASSIVVYQTFTNILFIFERTWIARSFGTETLAFYAIPLMLAFYMQGLLASVVQVLFPVVNELLQDTEKMIAIYKKATKVVLIVIVFIVGNYAASGRTFLHLWINEDFAEKSYPLLIILSLALGANALGMVAWQLAEAYRKPVLGVITTGVWLSISVPLMIYMTVGGNSEGVAVARLVGVLATLPVIPYTEKRFLGRIFLRFWLSILVRAGFSVVLMGLAEKLSLRLTSDSWVTLFVAAFTGSLTFCLALFFTRYFSADELQSFKGNILRRAKISAVR